MGRLAGVTYGEITRRLGRVGFQFDRYAKGSHEIWWHPTTRARTTIPHHPGTLAEGTVRAILRQACLSVDEFLNLGERNLTSIKTFECAAGYDRFRAVYCTLLPEPFQRRPICQSTAQP